MDATYFREKAAMCLRLAQFQLLELAQDFDRRARELDETEPRLDADSSE